MRISGPAMAVALGLLGSGMVARAADLRMPVAPSLAQTEVNGWQFAVSPYLWAAGLSGNTSQFGSPTIHVSPSFGDVLKNLDFAAMAIGEARYGRLSVFTDLMYTKISIGSGTPRGVIANRVNVSSETMAGLFGVGYSILEDQRGHLDIAVGVRAWKVSTQIAIDGGILAGRTFKDSATWASGMVGLRGRYDLTESFYLTGWGLIGKGGAKLDWDVAGGIGYKVNDRISAVLGYRALGVDFRENGFVFDVVQTGPIAGLVARF